MIWILAGLLILWEMTCLGRRALSFILNPLAPDQALVLSLGLGFGLMSYSILLIGLWGSLTYQTLLFFLVMLGIACLAKVYNHPFRLRQIQKELVPDFSMTGFLIVLAGGLALAVSLAGVLAPDISNDSLCYHLQLPKLFIQDSRIQFYPYEFNSTFPFFMEMLFTLGLALGSLTLAQFFHWATSLLLGLSLVSFGRIKIPLSVSWMAALLVMTTPGIINEMPTTYVDVAQACFTGLSFFCLLQWMDSRQTRWLVLSGIFSGWMMSIKYLAVISIAAQGFLIIYFSIREKLCLKLLFKRLLGYALPIMLCGGYWYWNAWAHRGNPIFPFLYSVFKSGNPLIHYDDIGVQKNSFEFLKVLWTLTLHPEKFEGYGVQIGPAYLMFLPLALKGIRKQPWLQATWFYTGFYMVCWFFLGQSLRFLFPILPVMGLLIGYGIYSFSDNSKIKQGLRLLVLGVLCAHLTLAVYHFRRDFKVAMGLQSKESYLLERERTYGISVYANQNLPANARIMNLDETHQFFFNQKMVRESLYEFFEKYSEKSKSWPETIRQIKLAGFTHILQPVHKGTLESLESLSPERLPRLLQERQNELAGALKLLYTTSFTDPDTHEKTDYFLYQIL